MARASTGALSGREHSTAMTPEEFQKFYPLLLGWIDATLRAQSENTRTVVSRGFPRLPLYFSADTLTSAKVVLVVINCQFRRCHHGG